MKTLLFTSIFALIALLMPSSLKKRVIFFGDSITEAGVHPGGYILRMDSMITKQGLGDRFELLGSGVSANKVYDLFLRMEDDVLKREPSIVVIYIGVNDVWHKRTGGTGTDADKFERFYEAIIKRLSDKNIKAVLCTPAVIGEKTDFSNEQDGDLNKYSNIIRDIAARNNLPLVDLRKAFLDYNLKNNPGNKEYGILTTDRVHLNARGNQLVAEEMLKIILAL
ncbi:MAG TPA: GDSL-type esterase/lipase family protein [Ferruginibacter sp.]|nr:G-D-S-L family lipolytic protein [Chitinophagaceae bacterium]MBP6286579.1 G-D-S-L family lipolytic protein [Ferruginibacter sp.]HQY12661.1 GDSL-type esterase/lipase family protein [Ferruginibacter sp.]